MRFAVTCNDYNDENGFYYGRVFDRINAESKQPTWSTRVLSKHQRRKDCSQFKKGSFSLNGPQGNSRVVLVFDVLKNRLIMCTFCITVLLSSF